MLVLLMVCPEKEENEKAGGDLEGYKKAPPPPR